MFITNENLLSINILNIFNFIFFLLNFCESISHNKKYYDKLKGYFSKCCSSSLKPSVKLITYINSSFLVKLNHKIPYIYIWNS